MRIRCAPRAAPLLAVFGAALAGCDSAVTGAFVPQHLRIEAVSPVSLNGVADGPLKSAPTVRALVGTDEPVPGITIHWSAAEGHVAGAATTAADGTASAVWSMPSAPGVYSLAVSADDIQETVVFQATTVADFDPPALRDLGLEADTVSVEAAPAPVELDVAAADDGSGLYWTLLYLRAPGGLQTATCSHYAAWDDSTSDRSVDCQILIPAYAEPGTWRADHLVLHDRAGNAAHFTASDLDALGMRPAIEVLSATPDTVAPALASLGFEPDTVDVATADAAVTFTLHLTDALSGVAGGQVELDEPGGSRLECIEMTLLEGTPADGAWRCTATIPAGSHTGDWIVRAVTAWDRTGNWHSYAAGDLDAAGFPTTLTVRATGAER